MHSQASYQAAVGAPVECLAMEEQAEIGVVIDRLGVVRFVSTSDGRLISEEQIPITERLTVDSFSAARPNTGIVVLSLSNGQALVVQHQYTVAFPNNVRVIRPSIYFPLGKELMTLNMAGLPLLHIGIQEEGAIR